MSDHRYEIRPRPFNAAVPLTMEYPIFDVETDRQVGFFPWDQQAHAVLTCERLNREWEAERARERGEQ